MSQQTIEENESPLGRVNELYGRILEECLAMTQFALKNGLQVGPGIMKAIEDFAKQATSASNTDPLGEGLVSAHNQLTSLIAPAKPNTLPRERQYYGKTGIPSRIPRLNITGRLIVLSLFFMLVFIISSLPTDINPDNMVKDFTQLDGKILLIYLIMLLSIAGLGASFAVLFQINLQIRKHTFDPSQGSAYYVQILLGIVAGLFISQLIDVSSGEGTLTLLSKPTLALVGGFSSSVVYRILKQVLTAFESLVKGDSEDTIAAQRQSLQIETQQMLQAGRVKAATELLPLRNQLPAGLQKKFDEQIERLLGASISKSQILNEPTETS